MSMAASEVKGMSALDNVKTPDADSHAFRLSAVLRTMFMCWAFTCVYTIKSSNESANHPGGKGHFHPLSFLNLGWNGS